MGVLQPQNGVESAGGLNLNPVLEALFTKPWREGEAACIPKAIATLEDFCAISAAFL
jgi:hypothetical protein